MKKSLVFLASLLTAMVVQSFIWSNFEYPDKYMWVDQARYIATKNPEAFNKFTAYGHPGTVVVEIAIIAHYLFDIPYVTASNGGLAIFNSFTIAACITLCFILRPKSTWYLVAGSLLVFNRLFMASTPPTAAASPLVVLLFLITLWLYEHAKKMRTWPFVFWGIVAGLSASSRTDITGVIALPLLFFMAFHLSWKKIAILVSTSALAFYISNPFMWTRPFGHMYDLVAEVHMHYADFYAIHLSLWAVLLISPLAIISIALAILIIFKRKRIPPVIAPQFLILMLAITAGISAILLTARLQSQHYFFPLAMMWETFLPLFILELLSRITSSVLRRLIIITIITLLIGAQITLIIHMFFLPEIIFICPKNSHYLFCNATTPMVW